jgi:hypothetical protein
MTTIAKMQYETKRLEEESRSSESRIEQLSKEVLQLEAAVEAADVAATTAGERAVGLEAIQVAGIYKSTSILKRMEISTGLV